MSTAVQLTGIACRRLVTPQHILDNVFIEFDQSKIGVMGDFNSAWIPPSAFNARQEDLIVVPGFVDVHLHGALGSDFIDHTAESIATISRWSAEGGTTSMIATLTIPNDDPGLEDFAKFVQLVRESAPLADDLNGKPGAVSALPGARVLGIHLEGPFLNPERKGAFDPAKHLRKPDRKFMDRVLDLCGDLLMKITIAPELPGGLDLIEMLTNDPRTRVEIAPGHTVSDYDFAKKVFENPRSRTITHMFNAMSSLHHRSPNLVTAALIDDRVSVELIPDCRHVAPPLVELLHRVKGRHRMIAITDATAVAGMPEGVQVASFGKTIAIRDGVPRLPDGTFAGSNVSMVEAFENLHRRMGMDIQEAVQLCTLNPARSVHCEKLIGDVAPGLRADFAVIDTAGKLQATIRDGMLVHAT